MSPLVIIEQRADNGQKFWDVKETGSDVVEYSSTLLAACEAFVLGWQRAAVADHPF